MTLLITISQAAEITGIPRSTLYRIIGSGEPTARKIGEKYGIHTTTLQTFLECFRGGQRKNKVSANRRRPTLRPSTRCLVQHFAAQ